MLNARWREAITDHVQYQRAAGAPETSIETRRIHIEHLARRVDAAPWAITTGVLLDYTARQDWKQATRRSHRTSLVHFYRWATVTGRMAENPAEGLPVVPLPPPMPMPAPQSAVDAGRAAPDLRVRLMVRLAATCGLRRAEIARLAREDLIERTTPDGRAWSLHVRGKGGKERLVPVTAAIATEILAMPPGWLFPNRWTGQPLTPRYVGNLVNRALPDHWTIHKLRHRAGSLAYEITGDLAVVQDLLGHASPVTTRSYVLAPDTRLRALVNQLDA